MTKKEIQEAMALDGWKFTPMYTANGYFCEAYIEIKSGVYLTLSPTRQRTQVRVYKELYELAKTINFQEGKK